MHPAKWKDHAFHQPDAPKGEVGTYGTVPTVQSYCSGRETCEKCQYYSWPRGIVSVDMSLAELFVGQLELVAWLEFEEGREGVGLDGAKCGHLTSMLAGKYDHLPTLLRHHSLQVLLYKYHLS